jgi:hypothetical protein
VHVEHRDCGGVGAPNRKRRGLAGSSIGGDDEQRDLARQESLRESGVRVKLCGV